MKKLFLIFLACIIFNCAAINNQRRTTYINTHPNTPAVFKDAIIRGAIKVGMTRNEVRAAWGSPSITSSNTWIYGGCCELGCTYEHVYFRNGKVIDWESTDSGIFVD